MKNGLDEIFKRKYGLNSGRSGANQRFCRSGQVVKFGLQNVYSRNKKEKIVKQELVMIQSFLLLKTPVTNELYNYVMETDYDIQTKNFPAVNISWIDAIKFCNLLSEKLSLEKCYTLNSASEKIIFDHSKNGFRLPKDEEWQYACRGNTEGYRYDNIEDIAWFKENSDGRLHEVRTKKKIILGFLI